MSLAEADRYLTTYIDFSAVIRKNCDEIGAFILENLINYIEKSIQKLHSIVIKLYQHCRNRRLFIYDQISYFLFIGEKNCQEIFDERIELCIKNIDKRKISLLCGFEEIFKDENNDEKLNQLYAIKSNNEDEQM